MVTPYQDRFRAELPGQTHGHSRMDTVLSCLVTTGCDDTPIGASTYEYRPSLQIAVQQPFNGHKKRVQITMYNMPIHAFINFIF